MVINHVTGHMKLLGPGHLMVHCPISMVALVNGAISCKESVKTSLKNNLFMASFPYF